MYSHLAVATERRETVLPRHGGLLRELQWLRAERLPSGKLRYVSKGGAGDSYTDAVVLALACVGGAAPTTSPMVMQPGLYNDAGDYEGDDYSDDEIDKLAALRSLPNVTEMGRDGLPDDWHVHDDDGGGWWP